MSLSLHLALRELRHDWQAALCFVAALLGVLAPLLILLALKNGVIGALVDGLVEDPNNREIVAIGARSHRTEFFEEMAAREDVAFILPATRTINAAANGLRHVKSRQIERNVTLIVSGPGDPLLPPGAEPATPGALWISERLAGALEAQPGAPLEMIIGRDIDGERQVVRRNFALTGIVPAERYGRQAAFIALEDLLAIERFRDDVGITPETWLEPQAAPESYASFRLYARDLEDLPRLEAALDERDVQARPRAQNAALLISFRDTLNVFYSGVAALAVLGFWAAMAANLRGMVERQRVSFSLLKMLGLSDRARAAVPIIQSVVLVSLGVLLTLVILVPALWALNAAFATGPLPSIARLGPSDIGATLALGLITALTSALWAARAVRSIETEDVLRHA